MLRRLIAVLFHALLAVALANGQPAYAGEPGRSRFAKPEAEQLFESGDRLLREGDYLEALADFDASLELETNVLSVYGKAQALNNLGRCREAVPVYKRVLRMLPDGSEARGVVTEALAACAEKLARADEPPAAAAPAPDSAPDPEAANPAPSEPAAARPWYKDPVAPALLGVGLVGVGVGTYLLVDARRLSNDEDIPYDEHLARNDRVESLATSGAVVLGVAGALLIGGSVRYVLVARKSKRARAAVSPTVSRRWAGVAVHGRF